ncbi:unnamed protein product [Coregonus sp. 'balchen']|nr:unnamed protein product [Coregonus sp. 'balchen']
MFNLAVGEVLRYTGQKFSTIAQTGGEIAINIEWQCNLDVSEERCEPHYSFTFAKYDKNENGTEFSTLHKAYAIRFDILVTGLAGKFNTVPTLINVVAAFTSVGLAGRAAVGCGIIGTTSTSSFITAFSSSVEYSSVPQSSSDS